MSDHYILNDNRKVVATDLMTWARWFENQDCRKVARETIGESDISTVFLGLDHSFDDGPPVLWETMVFGGKLDQEQDRCSGNWEQAEAMHARMVERVKAGTEPA